MTNEYQPGDPAVWSDQRTDKADRSIAAMHGEPLPDMFDVDQAEQGWPILLYEASKAALLLGGSTLVLASSAQSSEGLALGFLTTLCGGLQLYISGYDLAHPDYRSPRQASFPT